MITIVSGLPRSGTSLMMQMLEAGGMDVLADGVRQPDGGNPKGYYEYDKVKRLEADASWLAEAEGKVLKVVSFLLRSLPATFRYQVVFMERDLEEVLASQRELLHRLGNDGADDEARMRRSFERHLNGIRTWLETAHHMDVVDCDYNRLLREPEPVVAEIAVRISADLDPARMIAAVDPALYRRRRG